MIQVEELRITLKELKESHGVVAVKTGTEVEDLTHQEIELIRLISYDIVPLYVKIGGPAARTDIRILKSIGVDGIIAPLIESKYALDHFIETVSEIAGNTIKYGINIETKTAVENIENILSSNSIEYISQITIGRSDLAASLGVDPNSEECMEYVEKAAKAIRTKEKPFSVGGKITPSAAKLIQEKIAPNMINTTYLFFNTTAIQNKQDTIKNGLLFEINLIQFLSERFPERKSIHDNRIRNLRERIEM